ncbi:3-keto-5-aminohexanoate cleavage protein [Antrihabitans cavernicola]|uniref:3-keto-5-aminohexanoate cleavage protein n=1 Tax=Antrihabitans cavernicola TaxID=2495913 RepID=A0A5A7S7H4_9NOCA|nr:3-keto-5-aminohexanoate cleavage protein [Spelaeibacter cavernicola]KAA0022108.1 hypothetical protein FOY51_13955 [Spelaeibacter cavernicola]
MLQACLNGNRARSEHPALPVTPDQLAHDAHAAVLAGAESVHLHPKDDHGNDSLDSARVAAALGAVKREVNTPVGVTTGAWIDADPAARVASIRRWNSLPDYASVNWHEDGAEDVAAVLIERGVGIEAGLFTVDAVRTWQASRFAGECFRVLLELPDELSAAETVETADSMLAVLRRGPGSPRILLHGQGMSCWPALRYAGELGLDMRIGLEDTLLLPNGESAPDNRALVRAALDI